MSDTVFAPQCSQARRVGEAGQNSVDRGVGELPELGGQRLLSLGIEAGKNPLNEWAQEARGCGRTPAIATQLPYDEGPKAGWGPGKKRPNQAVLAQESGFFQFLNVNRGVRCGAPASR